MLKKAWIILKKVLFIVDKKQDKNYIISRLQGVIQTIPGQEIKKSITDFFLNSFKKHLV